jgi:hypothetical protein
MAKGDIETYYEDGQWRSRPEEGHGPTDVSAALISPPTTCREDEPR